MGLMIFCAAEKIKVQYSLAVLCTVTILAWHYPRSCPGWQDVCELRWRSNVLLERNDCIMDLAYLEGVWRYSYAVGKVFACGIREWPPSPDYGTAF